jgi:hypothetical protein
MPRRYVVERLGPDVMVVAMIDQFGGKDAEWAAYIGPTPELPDFGPEADASVEYVAQHGHKLYEKEGRPFFPGLSKVHYRR